jgi:hypothetical protein
MAATTAAAAEAVDASATAGELREPLTVEARLLDEGNNDQSSYRDYLRSRQPMPTYCGAWRQPDRRDIAQFQDEQPIFGFWFAYYYYIVFLVILCVIIAIYYIVKYTT